MHELVRCAPATAFAALGVHFNEQSDNNKSGALQALNSRLGGVCGGSRMHTAEQQKELHFTASTGAQKVHVLRRSIREHIYSERIQKGQGTHQISERYIEFSTLLCARNQEREKAFALHWPLTSDSARLSKGTHTPQEPHLKFYSEK